MHESTVSYSPTDQEPDVYSAQQRLDMLAKAEQFGHKLVNITHLLPHPQGYWLVKCENCLRFRMQSPPSDWKSEIGNHVANLIAFEQLEPKYWAPWMHWTCGKKLESASYHTSAVTATTINFAVIANTATSTVTAYASADPVEPKKKKKKAKNYDNSKYKHKYGPDWIYDHTYNQKLGKGPK